MSVLYTQAIEMGWTHCCIIAVTAVMLYGKRLHFSTFDIYCWKERSPWSIIEEIWKAVLSMAVLSIFEDLIYKTQKSYWVCPSSPLDAILCVSPIITLFRIYTLNITNHHGWKIYRSLLKTFSSLVETHLMSLENWQMVLLRAELHRDALGYCGTLIGCPRWPLQPISPGAAILDFTRTKTMVPGSEKEAAGMSWPR